jgi:apolipoprotein N-acyltransferase
MPEALDILATMLPPGTTLVTGAIRHDPPLGPDRRLLPTTRTLNSILALNERAQVDDIYDKIKLVPFGEYVPLESALSVIGIQKLTHGRGAFSTGTSPRRLMNIPGLPPALGLVCYEALFPGDIVQGKARPGVMINVTNDGWFGHSTGPYQHFLQSRVRAVEEGVPLIRAANNGISAIVDPYGRTLQMLGLDVRGVMDSALPAALPPTVYSRTGDWMLVLVLAAFAALAGVLGKTRH